jgi:hypothetical protein
MFVNYCFFYVMFAMLEVYKVCVRKLFIWRGGRRANNFFFFFKKKKKFVYQEKKKKRIWVYWGAKSIKKPQIIQNQPT